MCGIFGIVSNTTINNKNFSQLVDHARQRGRDSSGLVYLANGQYHIARADDDIKKLLKRTALGNTSIALGHSRLITNGLSDNQPVVRGDLCAIHNGIIVDEDVVWQKIKVKRHLVIDSELIVAIAEKNLAEGIEVQEIPEQIFSLCHGVIACALMLPEKGKLLLFSNNGSLYSGQMGNDIYFASERYVLDQLHCQHVTQIKNDIKLIDIPQSAQAFAIRDDKKRVENLIPQFIFNQQEERLLQFDVPPIKRCSQCLLPETMPYIKFDHEGVCNYCHHYKPRNNPKPKEELFELVKPYRRKGNELDCIVPFSGGRDSCYGLHLIIHELKMKPVTYTYDWGMVTDLGRRKISRMCAQLGVENIIVAADISKKRDNIRKNLLVWAWLKSSHASFFYRWIIQYNLKKADKILSTSHVMAKETSHYTNKPIEVTPFGIDMQKFKPEVSDGLFGSNDIVVGTVKTLEYKYGIEYLIRSFKIVKDRQPELPLKLLIVGGGSLEQELKGLCQQLKIENITIFTGDVPYSQVTKYHNMLSVSESESFGFAIIEASACEKPVVVSNVGGLPEVVEDGVTGFVVPSQNPEKTAQAIEKLIVDKELQEQMGKAGRARVAWLYDWNNNVAQMIKIYEDLPR